MGKRYYCDYCDRSFIDEVRSRKKHLTGTAHLRNRKIHYASCRDLKTLIEEESTKEECFKFRSTGHCPFGENCYRSHYRREQLEMFKNQLAAENDRKIYQSLAEIGTIDSWLQKRNEFIPTQKSEVADDTHHSFPVYPRSHSSTILPISLQPLDLNHLISCDIASWG